MSIFGKIASLALALTTTLVYGKHDGEYIHNLNTEFKTPCFEWAKPLEKPPRVLIISQLGYDSRSIVELMQRMDLKCDTFMSMSHDKIGADDLWNGAVAGTGQAEKENELLALLKNDYDVYVFSNFPVNGIPREALRIIAGRIAEQGASLVTTCGEWYALQPFKEDMTNLPLPEGESEIMSMIDRAALSNGAFSEDSKKPANRSLVKTFRFGKGKVVVLCYDKGALGLFPRQQFNREWLARTECDSVFFQRTLLWAAGHQPALTASCVQNIKAGTEGFIQDMLASSGLVFRFAGKEGAKGEALIRLRDQDSRIVWSSTLQFSIEKDSTLIPARPPMLAPGNYFMDLIIKQGRFVDNIGEFMVKVESPLGETALSTDKDSYKDKEAIKYELNTSLPAKEKLEIRTRIIDTMRGRVWLDSSRQVSPGQKFSGSVSAVCSSHGSLSGLPACLRREGSRKSIQAALLPESRTARLFQLCMGWRYRNPSLHGNNSGARSRI